MWLTFAPLLLGAAPTPAARMPMSLYVVEEVPNDKGLIETASLVRIAPGRDGRPTKTTLVSVDSGFFFRGPIAHRIVGGRFVVTAQGGVIDLRSNIIVNDETRGGELLGVEGGRVVYRIRNTPDIYAFDLENAQLEKLTDPGRWGLPGVCSPDGTKSVEAKRDGSIVLHTLDGMRKVLGRGYFYELSMAASSPFMGVPCLWLDDAHVLTQKSNHKLVILDMAGGSQPLPEIAGTPKLTSPPWLRFDGRGQVIYRCHHEEGEYLIDVAGKKWSPLEWYALGHGFDAAAKEGDNRVRHNGKVIGEWFVKVLDAQTAAGRIAFPYVAPGGGNLGEPQGIALWDTVTGRWQTINFRVGTVIGWAAAAPDKPD